MLILPSYSCFKRYWLILHSAFVVRTQKFYRLGKKINRKALLPESRRTFKKLTLRSSVALISCQDNMFILHLSKNQSSILHWTKCGKYSLDDVQKRFCEQWLFGHRHNWIPTSTVTLTGVNLGVTSFPTPSFGFVENGMQHVISFSCKVWIVSKKGRGSINLWF